MTSIWFSSSRHLGFRLLQVSYTMTYSTDNSLYLHLFPGFSSACVCSKHDCIENLTNPSKNDGSMQYSFSPKVSFRKTSFYEPSTGKTFPVHGLISDYPKRRFHFIHRTKQNKKSHGPRHLVRLRSDAVLRIYVEVHYVILRPS